MAKIQKIKIIFAVCSLSFIAIPALAAEVSFDAKTQEIKTDQLFEVGVFINTDNEEINAIEGKIIFPQDLLEVKKVNDANSIINFWIEKPKTATEGQIAFSGITPGGYSGSQGLIFSTTFLAKKEDAGTVEFSGVKALKNDGKGTEAPLVISNFQFLISRQDSVPQISIPETEDRNPPEEFTPQIAADPVIFEGKWFLVFATQDKGSGIDHYEVCERNKECVVAESPYLLKNQNLDEKIVVKAIDKSGNERVAVLPAQKPAAWYKNYLILATIILVMAIVYLIWEFLWRKRKR